MGDLFQSGEGIAASAVITAVFNNRCNDLKLFFKRKPVRIAQQDQLILIFQCIQMIPVPVQQFGNMGVHIQMAGNTFQDDQLLCTVRFPAECG